MEKLKIILCCADDTHKLGLLLGNLVKEQTIIALTGELGAGKTCLVQGVGVGLGVKEPINSPTFTTINEYHSGRLPLYHLDLYRLLDDPKVEAALGGQPLDLLRAELDEIMSGGSVVVIEWAEFIRPYLPLDHLWLSLEYTSDGNQRVCFISAGGTTSGALLSAISKNVACKSL